MARGCPPGVLCMSNGLVFGFLGTAILAVVALYFIGPSSQSVRATSQMYMPTTMDRALAPPPPALPPTVVNVMGGRGGDDRYTRAPQPLRDWMAPPEFPPRGGIASIPINIPTQGLPESFQSVGMLHVDGQMLPLYGRRTTGSSDRWNYYTRTDTYNPIPIPVAYKKRDCMDDVGCNEVMSGEHVHLEGADKSGKVTLYKYDGPKYYPGLL
jgi:hypothetical protein